MSVVKRVCALSPAFLLNLWCGTVHTVPLCRLLPDTTVLKSHCSFNVATATFADVVNEFHLTSALDSTHQSVVALTTPTVQLSFSAEYSSARDATEPIRAAVPVKSVLLRRYFASSKEATAFVGALRLRINQTFTCRSDTSNTDSQSMLCRDPNTPSVEIRYLWTNQDEDPSAKGRFEVAILAQFL